MSFYSISRSATHTILSVFLAPLEVESVINEVNTPNVVSQQYLTSETILNKITFDLSVISIDGLVGSADSLRAIDYEFCIPANEQLLEEIRAINPNIQYYPHSQGRIGCTKDQYLCIGNTHHPNWKNILMSIAQLD
jgi:hypothetical protein